MAIYDRDYLTTLPLLYVKATEYSESDWNKYNSDVGDAILRIIASSSHSIDYYFRHFLASLVLPNDDWNQKSLIWELTGYKPNYIRADYLMVQLYWPDCGLDSYVPLYKYTPFKVVADGVEYTFLCAQDYFIPPLTTRQNVRIVNGTLRTIEQDYTQIQKNKIFLTDQDIDYDLVSLTVSSIEWKQVRNVYYSPETERIFSVHKEEDGIYLYLHKSWENYVDSFDTSFIIRYVESDYDFSIYTSDCLEITFAEELLTLDGDDVSEFYKIIPLLTADALDSSTLMPSTTEGNRAITVLDYEMNASLFPGIAACKAYDWNTPAISRDPFEVALVCCDSHGNLADHMKQVIKNYLESIGSPLINVIVYEPQFQKQNIMVILDIGEYKETIAEIQIKSVVYQAIEDFYKIGNLKPGRVVKTKELNSLIMHSDTRIYFATTTFTNSVTKHPRIIPILGEVTIITSAVAYNYADAGHVEIENAYIGLIQCDSNLTCQDRMVQINLHFMDRGKSNFIIPIDKLPAQAFDFVSYEIRKPILGIGSLDFPQTDFGVGDGFIEVLCTGGSVDGPKYGFVFETDGTAVIGKYSTEIIPTVEAELSFTNYIGTFYDIPSLSIELEENSIEEIKEKLAEAFNSIPALVDSSYKKFELVGDDIEYDSPTQSSKLYPKIEFTTGESIELVDSASIEKENDGPPTAGAKQGENGAGIDYLNEDGNFTIQSKKVPLKANVPIPVSASEEVLSLEKVFVAYSYLYGDAATAEEKATIDVITFIIKNQILHSYEDYLNFKYSGYGRFIGSSTLYGELNFNAEVKLHIKDYTKEYVPIGSDVYKESEIYQSHYYVRDIHGNELNWYYVNTNPLHIVNSTTFLGKGYKVKFDLLRDQHLYVYTDVSTTRGFIYSSDMESTDFNVE